MPASGQNDERIDTLQYSIIIYLVYLLPGAALQIVIMIQKNLNY